MRKTILLLFLVLYPSFASAAWPGNCTRIFFRQFLTETNIVAARTSLTTDSNGQFVWGPFTGTITQEYTNVYVWSAYFDGTQWQIVAETNATITANLRNQLTVSGTRIYTSSNVPAAMLAALPSCPNPCAVLANTNNYSLESHLSNMTPATGNACYENCQQSSEILWTDCINDSCVSGLKFTYTGQTCTNEPIVFDQDDSPPTRCNTQLEDKISACGGSLNVQSFDFETCSGVCAPDDCHSAWLAKVSECGGIMAVSSWSSETCTGVCASDPVPNSDNPPDGVSPQLVESDVTENQDGTSTRTTSTTYNYQGTTYTETTITNYDSQGNPTGTTVTTRQGTQQQPVNPGVPGNLELDTSVGDAKNWMEHDDPAAVAQARATQDFQTPLAVGPLPLDMDLNISGSPVLSGVMFGRTIEIRFDRPWMQSGYSIMSALLVGIGYLQVFLMINRTIIER